MTGVRLTNPITADVWEGIRARHSLVESAGQPTEAARAMAYLSHLDRRDLIAEIERLQAKIDALMLEHCPDEMTPEQLAEWAKHQRPSHEPNVIKPADCLHASMRCERCGDTFSRQDGVQ